MNLKHWLIMAAIATTPCASALAQDTRSASQASQTTTSSASYNNDAGQWLASGFVGSNFANNAKPASMNFGGSFAHLWKNTLGVELDASFTPNFQLQNRFLGTGVKPDVNTYMANAIWAKPMGSNGQLKPFVSGGVGAISLRSGSATSTMASSNSTRFGGDVGGGVMAFSGRWGFKADVRYLRATGTYNTVSTPANPTQPNPTPPGPYGILAIGAGTASTTSAALATPPPTVAATSLADAALAGLHFWRANVGVAVRW